VCFADIRQHLTLSILAHFQNGDRKRRLMPTTNVCPNFSFRGLRKKFVTLFRDYFRHAYKLHTSQRQPSTRTGEFTMAAAGQASGATRAAPGIIAQSRFIYHLYSLAVSTGDVNRAFITSIQKSPGNPRRPMGIDHTHPIPYPHRWESPQPRQPLVKNNKNKAVGTDRGSDRRAK